MADFIIPREEHDKNEVVKFIKDKISESKDELSYGSSYSDIAHRAKIQVLNEVLDFINGEKGA